jgi:hypothetical protein
MLFEPLINIFLKNYIIKGLFDSGVLEERRGKGR